MTTPQDPPSIESTPLAKGLDEADGWVGMNVQFLVDETTGADSVVFGRTVFRPGHSSHERHRHAHAEEAILIISGRGIAINGDTEIPVGPGSVVFHPRNEWHGFKNLSESEPVEMLWVWAGAASKEAAGYEVDH